MQKLRRGRPYFSYRSDDETGQTLIEGMGGAHLEIISDRLLREFGVSATVGRPQVAYKETVTGEVQGEGKYVVNRMATVSMANVS